MCSSSTKWFVYRKKILLFQSQTNSIGVIMKNLTYKFCVLLVALISFASCSKDSLEEMETASLGTEPVPLNYSAVEMEVLDLVNAYRMEKGLSQLDYMDDISRQAMDHNTHMLENNEVCHHDFPSRYTALVNGVGAKAVSENVAFAYRSAEAVVNAWIKSDGHRINMEGDHTHFGISVKEDQDGKPYYTNIFIRN